MRPHAPIVGSHLPTPNERIAAHTEIQMKRSPKTYFALPRSKKNELNVATAVMHSEPPSQMGFDEPVDERIDATDEAAERKLRPHVRPALVGERRAELGGEERIGNEEDGHQEDQPREALGALARHGSDRVEPDERADEEEEHVEAPEVLLELRLLLERR